MSKNRYEQINRLRSDIQNKYYNNAMVTSKLFFEEFAKYYELVDTDTDNVCSFAVSVDELFTLTKFYKNSPTKDRYGLFRPISQRCGNWSEEYGYEYLIGYFLGNCVLNIKCGIPTDRPYMPAAFVYDGQHRMLMVVKILNFIQKINKKSFKTCLDQYRKTNDIGMNEHRGIVELYKWINSTIETDMGYDYVMENESEYPYLSSIRETPIRLEVTLATEKSLRRTILFKMNHQENAWSTIRHIWSAVWSDADNHTLLKSITQNNSDNTEWLNQHYKPNFPNLFHQSNTVFRKSLRIEEGQGDKDGLESLVWAQVLSCIDDTKRQSPIDIGNIYTNEHNIRKQLMLTKKNAEEHFEYQGKMKQIVDLYYVDNTQKYKDDAMLLMDIIKLALGWINKDISRVNGKIEIYNKKLRDAIKNTLYNLVGKKFNSIIVTEKNYNSLSKHAKRFSLAHEDTSHVFLSYLRKLIYGCKKNNQYNIELVCDMFMVSFEKHVIEFVTNVNKLKKLESLDNSYEQRTPTLLQLCENAYNDTVKSMKSSYIINKDETVLV